MTSPILVSISQAFKIPPSLAFWDLGSAFLVLGLDSRARSAFSRGVIGLYGNIQEAASGEKSRAFLR